VKKCEFMMSLANVIVYLHTRNPPIIHRDIKPENFLLRADWTPVLSDFGVSRVADRDSELAERCGYPIVDGPRAPQSREP
jgi:serine/threonine protein kinase